eukprot:19096-Heterococcus_DN1.PRE.2
MSAVVRAHKRSAFSEDLLQQAVILQNVLDHVGPGHWCFVAEVSSLWRDLYRRVASRETQSNDPYSTKTIMCVPQMTTFSAVFASPSRVRCAHARGLSYTGEIHQRTAGMYADTATLQAARELGVPYTHAVMVGAARSNALAVVQFLRAEGCPWSSFVFGIAVRRRDIPVLAFLIREKCPSGARHVLSTGACVPPAALNADNSEFRARAPQVGATYSQLNADFFEYDANLMLLSEFQANNNMMMLGLADQFGDDDFEFW